MTQNSKTTAAKPSVSRRWLLQSSFLGITLASIPGLATAAYPVRKLRRLRKIPKRVALYQFHPMGPQACGNCHHFIPPISCQIVRGPIVDYGWCRFWAAHVHGHDGPGGMRGY
jgi:hypothetical protein